MTNEHPIKSPRKLIEVALPLDKINEEAARRKRKAPKGYPTTLHKWWAQRPVAAARAVIFGQLVNDPSWKWEIEHPGEIPPGHLKATWAKSRKRLFSILDDMIKWENTVDDTVLDRARVEIQRSWEETCELNKDHPQAGTLFNPKTPPSLCDPFSGSGTIPMEGQRLGLRVFASDLNPVAVLIGKASFDVPTRFAGRAPIGPQVEAESELLREGWPRATGLAEDVRRYGSWVEAEARKRVGRLYPQIEITKEMVKGRADLKGQSGTKVDVVAWIWARTVKSPNPAFSDVHIPLAGTFLLSTKSGKEAFVDPVIEGRNYHFAVKVGKPPAEASGGTKLAKGNSFRCLLSNTPIPYSYVDEEISAGRGGFKMMAVVVDGPHGRQYLPATEEMERLALGAKAAWKPETPTRGTFGSNAQGRIYGFRTFGDYFLPRQLSTLTTLCDLLADVRNKVKADAASKGFPEDDRGLEAGGCGAAAYADAIRAHPPMLD